MLCCIGLFIGFAIDSIVGGPWMLIMPAIGFGLGLIGDIKLMHSKHKAQKDYKKGCCGSMHIYDKKAGEDA